MAYRYKRSKAVLPAFIFLLLNSLCVRAQYHPVNDTTYYIRFPGSLTSRLYTSQKYTDFTLKDKNTRNIHYYPNTTFNLGVGATYNNLSLNIAYGFGFLNQGPEKGKTKYLDLQSHYYWRKWITDIEGQFYHGYHLSKGFATDGGKYYYRGDIKVALFGISQYRIFNPARFSYRAAFTQNEWQKKSAGTFLAGAGIYYGVVNADSSLIPQSIQQTYPGKNIQKVNYFSFGPGIGYAYTLVLHQYVFFTGSVTTSLNFSFTNENLLANQGFHFSVKPVTRFRLAAGYNSRTWNVSANWVKDNVPFGGVDKKSNYVFNTGNYRFVIAKRFNTGSRLRKHLRLIFNVLKD
ncbi:MAG TPA: DUF4421 domain-containing protein [Hanamia sp.]|nr:DUF4421 domain-containing protein [Hanamia sp.]